MENYPKLEDCRLDSMESLENCRLKNCRFDKTFNPKKVSMDRKMKSMNLIFFHIFAGLLYTDLILSISFVVKSIFPKWMWIFVIFQFFMYMYYKFKKGE